MLNEKFLLDEFEVSGTKVDDFETLIMDIDQRTIPIKRCLKNFIIVSIKDTEYPSSDEMSGWYLDPENPSNNGRLRVCKVPKNAELGRRMNVLLEETIQKSPTMLYDKESSTMWFISDAATNTMAQRIEVTGKAIQEHSLERDLYIAKKFNVDVVSTLIIKQYQQVGKIFSFMGGNYLHIPLYTLCVIYKDLAGGSKLGPMSCETWKVTHERIRISFAFKEYAKKISTIYNLKREMIPCIEMTTSDIGESSFIIRGYWKTPEGAIVYDHRISREHRGNRFLDEIETDIKEQIFEKYSELPERLLKLAAIDITPPDLNLEGARDSGKNHKIICEAFHSVFKKLNMVIPLGKKNLMSLERCIDFNIVRDDLHYTAYDLIMDVFALTETMQSFFDTEGISKEKVRKFREEISKAAYVDFS